MTFRPITFAKTSDLKMGEMRIFTAQEIKVLLTNVNGEIHALGAFCTHYGAPLEDGVLSSGRIICPWHQAAFDAISGDLLEPPACEALPRYEVRLEGDNIVVMIPENLAPGRMPEMKTKDSNADGRTFIIIGAGAASFMAAQTLRQEGFTGRLTMISAEEELPYDRTALSKPYLQGKMEKEGLPLRQSDFYSKFGIELLLNSRVVEVEAAKKSLTLETGKTLKYDKLLLASGATPRTLSVPGHDLQGIFVLRSRADADSIIAAAAAAPRVAIIGSSFIGLETAFSLTVRGLAVTVISNEALPFERQFGKQIGELFLKAHQAKGVIFKLNSAVSRFEGKRKVEAVPLENGERLTADLVVVGIGVRPATDYLKGFPIEQDGSVKADRFLQVREDVYAAGDIVTYPDSASGQWRRLEHWRTALQQGRAAARNMLGKETPFDGVPFFWTNQAGLGLRYVGYAKSWDEIVVNGELSKDFLAFYVEKDKIAAVAGMKRDRDMIAVHELMRRGKMPEMGELKRQKFNLQALI
jgi:NADPH-dependent 2,4-dienoyl-CoA reductase/sulfur reductase-like enzyme/nitrite reductase/ring-hydroxylating ferredoxin subunit